MTASLISGQTVTTTIPNADRYRLEAFEGFDSDVRLVCTVCDALYPLSNPVTIMAVGMRVAEHICPEWATNAADHEAEAARLLAEAATLREGRRPTWR